MRFAFSMGHPHAWSNWCVCTCKRLVKGCVLNYSHIYTHNVPKVDPSMPFNMMDGLSWMVTLLQRLSKRPESLCMNLGCVAPRSTPGKGTQPNRAISWHPLQIPRENVSTRVRNASNSAFRCSLNRIEPAQPKERNVRACVILFDANQCIPLALSWQSAKLNPPQNTKPLNSLREIDPLVRSLMFTSQASKPALKNAETYVYIYVHEYVCPDAFK